MVIDGLDEFVHVGVRKKILQLFQHNHQRNVSLLIFSRQSVGGTCDISENAAVMDIEATKSDIREYCVTTIDQDDKLHELAQSQLRESVANEVSERASGM